MFAKANDIKIPESCEQNESASTDWLKGVMK